MKNPLVVCNRELKIVFVALCVLLGWLLLIGVANAESSLSFGIGPEADSPGPGCNKYDWNYSAIFLSHKLLEKGPWSLGFEGQLGYFNFEREDDLIAAGGSFIGDYTFFKNKPIQPFIEAGLGLGICNGTPSDGVLNDGLKGIIQAGAGIKIPIKDKKIKIGYRLNHWSSAFKNDAGLNSHMILIGLEW